MITGKIKNQVDAVWKIFWEGGITNSIDVLEQMTYLFFMKMLDDNQTRLENDYRQMMFGSGEAIEVDLPNAVFKKGNWKNPETEREVPYESLRWSRFSQMTPEQMLKTVRDDVFVFIRTMSDSKTSAYTRFMQNAVFLIQQPRMLQRLVTSISEIEMQNRDTMGDTYEYVLGKMAESGTNGQFRSPRHIIRMMVELMKPTLEDRICDPALGTAGFDVESAKYIMEHYKTLLTNKQAGKHFRTTMFNGFDTDQKMLRIAAMNLMLHGVEDPQISYRDSLSNDNNDTERYTLCLSNPPFSGSLDEEAVNSSLLTLTKTKKTELLFMSLFIRMLEVGGRCASIVPDGVLFGTSKAHIALRKELVDHQQLHAIISMPSGVFKPYAGVSTAVIIFTKTNHADTDKVWFYDMRADGFSLDDKRNQIDENDIPDIIARYHNLAGEADRTRKDQSFLVPVEEIRENDYSLAINKYKEVEREKVVYDAPEVILGRFEELQKSIAEDIETFKAKFMSK
jgi:type I restriction enzyme M protein